MTPLEALWLGIIQGLTEFFPVSSSGHLVIGQALLGLEETGVVFEVAVHVATLVSVLVFYRRRVAGLVVDALRGRREALEYGGKLAVATLPAVILVLLAGDFLEALFDRPAVAGIALLVTGGILWTTRWTLPRAEHPEPGWLSAWWIGCAQAFAIVPGISRSGSTVAMSLGLGIRPAAAAEFSFLMSVPAILGAAVTKFDELTQVAAEAVWPLVVGSAAAGVAGVAAIWLFVAMLRRQSFHVFSYYTWVAGAAFLAWLHWA
ncbi:MAG: undecaprenyl-diphosphate phosphatase [Myxococcota bacterium]